MDTPLEILKKARDMEDSSQGNQGNVLSDQDRRIIRTMISEIKSSERISHDQVAKILGCSTSVVSQVLAGKYGGDSDKFLIRGRRWLADRAERHEAPPVGYVSTSEGDQILCICQHAWNMPCIGKVMVDSGAGKTMALREYARRRRDRAIYLQVGEAMSGRTGLLLELSRCLKLHGRSGLALGRLYTDVRDRLAKYYQGGQNAPTILLVDEATTLRAESINILRNLHDDPAVRLAVVLADTARMDVNLAARPMSGGVEQLRSRFGATYEPDPHRAALARDVRAVAGGVLDSISSEVNLGPESVNFLTGLAGAAGRYRNVVHRLMAVHYLAEASKTEPSFSVSELDFAATLVGGQCQIKHNDSPFGTLGPRGAAAAIARAS